MMESFVVQIRETVQRVTIVWLLHKADLCKRVQRRKPILNKPISVARHKNCCWPIAFSKSASIWTILNKKKIRTKLSGTRCTLLIQTNTRRLTAVIAVKGFSVKYCPRRLMRAKASFHDYFSALWVGQWQLTQLFVSHVCTHTAEINRGKGRAKDWVSENPHMALCKFYVTTQYIQCHV